MERIREATTPDSVPRGRWRSQIQRALTWLRSSASADNPVRMVCEVQCLLQAYKKVRHSMHEIYKVSFLFLFGEGGGDEDISEYLVGGCSGYVGVFPFVLIVYPLVFASRPIICVCVCVCARVCL